MYVENEISSCGETYIVIKSTRETKLQSLIKNRFPDRYKSVYSVKQLIYTKYYYVNIFNVLVNY